MPRRRKGKSQRKNVHKLGEEEDADVSRAPHSFVVPLGKASKCVKELVSDFRKVMEPFTASKIKPRPGNVVKDYVQVAGPLNVSHFIGFTKTDLGPYIKIARFPRGPTLTFRVSQYVMARDVKSALKRQVTYEKQFLHAPLLIMNGFSGEARDIQLTSSMFQNMFPSINVAQIQLKTIRRCVLLNRDEETGEIEFRHYTIKVVPVGLSKGIKKIAVGKVPNLARFEDMTEFLASKGNMTSDSEGEDDESSKVTLPQGVSARGSLPQEQSAIRLVELGPRMTLNLIKIEEGLFDGDVMYHKLYQKTEEEKKKIRIAREKAKKEKEKRTREQLLNVKKKERAKDAHKDKSLAGMQKKIKGIDAEDLPKGFEGQRAEKSDEDEGMEDEGQDENRHRDDDEEYYRQAVGKAPDKDLFDKKDDRKRRSDFKDKRFKKKRKTDDKDTKKKFGGQGGEKPSFGTKKKFGGDKPSFTPGRNKNSSGNSGGGTKGDFKNRPAKGAKPKFRVSIKSKSKFQSKSNSKRKAK